jgi:hypothetical protein
MFNIGKFHFLPMGERVNTYAMDMTVYTILHWIQHILPSDSNNVDPD